MGYGAYMKVVNDTDSTIKLFVTDVKCMHDNIDYFNDQNVAAHAQLPSDKDKGHYIEDKSSGSCFFEESKFTLKVDKIGEVTFHSHTANITVEDNTNPDVLNTMVNNSGDQADIEVTVSF